MLDSTDVYKGFHIFDPPIEIPPGHGVSVRAARRAMCVVTSWQWQEVSQ